MENNKTKQLTDLFNNILKDPEYKKYCNYYNFTDIESDKNMKAFIIWKSFGMNLN